MTHRIFYGTDFKLTDSDKKMFSREGYECKDLLQGRAGLPVVVMFGSGIYLSSGGRSLLYN